MLLICIQIMTLLRTILKRVLYALITLLLNPSFEKGKRRG
ncbi:hypothetical protein sync_2047 [Synechococcus sp. CC9311]|nr:hypothetical protein sync_2047 [Synechococcus sp. CC9311]